MSFCGLRLEGISGGLVDIFLRLVDKIFIFDRYIFRIKIIWI